MQHASSSSRAGFAARLRAGQLRDTELAWVLLAPTAVLLGGVMLYPMLSVFFTSWRVQDPSDPASVHLGLGNTARLFGDERFVGAFWRTVWFGICTVAGSFVVGLPLALLANVRTRWRWLVRVSLLLPWAMPQVITGLMFAWLFNSQYGLFNDLLQRLGLPPQYWLIRPDLAVVALFATIIWKTSSFVALILLGGLQSIPQELEEAARVDGANPWQVFTKITWPLLRPAVLVALVFRTLSALQVYDIPQTLTLGGPNYATETLGMYIQKNTVEFTDAGYGATISLSLFVLALVVTALYIRFIRPADGA